MITAGTYRHRLQQVQMGVPLYGWGVRHRSTRSKEDEECRQHNDPQDRGPNPRHNAIPLLVLGLSLLCDCWQQ